MFLRKLIQVHPKPTTKDKIKLLWITDVTSKGRGDYDYLQEISNQSYLEKLGLQIEQVELLRIVCVPQNNDALIKKDVRKKLNQGEKIIVTLDDVLINQSSDNTRVVLYNPQKRNRSKLLDSVFNEPIYENVDFLICVSSESITGEISTYKKKYPDVISFFIGAHGSDLSIIKLDSKHKFQIGVENGFLMNSIVSSSKLDRVKALTSLEDKNYLKTLMGEQSPEDFLEHTLFIPAYLQDTQIAKIFIKAIIKSNLDDEYAHGLTFHLSLHENVKERDFCTPQAIYKSVFDEEITQLLVKRGYTNICIDGFSSKETLHLPWEQKISDQITTKTVRIIANQWMKNKSDFNLLFGAAQIIAGTSGDNTLNNALAKGVIPFYATQSWNKGFKERFIKYLLTKLPNQEDSELINQMEKLLFTMMPEINYFTHIKKELKAEVRVKSQALSDVLTQAHESGLLKILKDVINNIQQTNNFNTIIKENIIEPINNCLNDEKISKRRRL